MRPKCAVILAVVMVCSAGCVSRHYDYGGAGFEPYTYAACNGWQWVVTALPPQDFVALRALADANPSARHIQSYASEVWYRAPEGGVQLCRGDNVPHEACVTEWWEFRKNTDGWKLVNGGDWDCKVDHPTVTE